MKRNHLIGSMLLAFGVLAIPVQILADESTPLNYTNESALALASVHRYDNRYKSAETVSEVDTVEKDGSSASKANPADCSFTPDETFAVTDAICH